MNGSRFLTEPTQTSLSTHAQLLHNDPDLPTMPQTLFSKSVMPQVFACYTDIGTTDKPHWRLITRRILPESENKTYDQEQEEIEKEARQLGLDTKLTHRRTAREAVYDNMVTQTVTSGGMTAKGDRTSTFMAPKIPIMVGFMRMNGLSIGGHRVSNKNYNHGVVLCR